MIRYEIYATDYQDFQICHHQNKDDIFKESLLYRKINQFSFELKKLFYMLSNITKNLNK